MADFLCGYDRSHIPDLLGILDNLAVMQVLRRRWEIKR